MSDAWEYRVLIGIESADFFIAGATFRIRQVLLLICQVRQTRRRKGYHHHKRASGEASSEIGESVSLPFQVLARLSSADGRHNLRIHLGHLLALGMEPLQVLLRQLMKAWI